MGDRHLLEELARLHGVQTAFHDGLGQHRVCSDESLLSVLRALGVPLDDRRDAPEALRAGQLEAWERTLAPVTVAWGQQPARVRLRLPDDRCSGPYRVTISLEDGDLLDRTGELADAETTDGAEVEGARFREVSLGLDAVLPHGRHRLEVEIHGDLHAGWIFAAPERAHAPEDQRAWGLFAPLYALHSARSTGGGDLTDLESLVDLAAEMGGGVVGTLPLVASFLGHHPFDPSPYSPVSRLFWNELYLDPVRVPELERSPRAREILSSAEWRREAEELRSLPMVDYRRQMALRRRVLEELAETFFGQNDGSDIAEFVAQRPRVLDYARFRAAVETRGDVWHVWPDRMRDGLLEPGDWEEEAFRYHLYVQWRTSEQLTAVCDRAREHGPGIYLDMPLGVHPDGYDAWRERGSFLMGCAAGAPPDQLFTAGQNWGFAPLSPEGIRADGYRYLRDCLRHQMRLSGVLRIDHVMGLHRIYCVPPGAEATDGVYVHYRADELYAALTLESTRHRTMLVGEDLGTVPPEVREAMEAHSLRRMYVFPFELRPGQEPMVQPARPDAVACVDTHDMPTFEAWFTGRDVDDRLDLGLMDEHAAEAERQDRWRTMEALAAHLGVPCEPGPVLRAALERLAESDTPLLLVNLEDLWLEPDPQNVPGTSHERPNWKRKAAHALETIRQMPEVVDVMREVSRRRRRQDP